MLCIRTVLTALLLVGVVSACDDDENDVATVRVVHSAPGAPPIDVFLDRLEAPIATGLAYGQVSRIVQLEPMFDYRMIVRVSGTGTVLDDRVVLDLRSNDRVTAVAVGDVAATDPAEAFGVVTLLQDFGPVALDETRVRFLNAAPDTAALTIDVNADGIVDVEALPRFEASPAEGIPLPADTSLQIGVLPDNQAPTAFTSPELPRDELLVIATGNVTDLPRTTTGLQLLVIGSAGVIGMVKQNPTVYALNASPDAPSLDVRLGDLGPVVFGNLVFGALASTQVAPGDYTLAFFPVGDQGTTPIVTGGLLGLAAGERYLAVATGMLTPVGDEQRFQVFVYLEQFDLGQTPLIRAVQESPDVPLVDISTATGDMLNTPALFPELGFGEASLPGGLVLFSSPGIRLGVAPARSTNAFATFNVSTLPTARAFMILGGALTPAPGEQGLQMFIIDTSISPWVITTLLPNPPS